MILEILEAYRTTNLEVLDPDDLQRVDEAITCLD